MSSFDHTTLIQNIKSLKRLGATKTEFEEMLAVCVYMGGGPALMYCSEALHSWDNMV